MVWIHPGIRTVSPVVRTSIDMIPWRIKPWISVYDRWNWQIITIIDRELWRKVTILILTNDGEIFCEMLKLIHKGTAHKFKRFGTNSSQWFGLNWRVILGLVELNRRHRGLLTGGSTPQANTPSTACKHLFLLLLQTENLPTVRLQPTSQVAHSLTAHLLKAHTAFYLTQSSFRLACKPVAPITWTRIHVRVPLASQSIHVHWKVELKSFPTIYDTHISINIGMPYTIGKPSNSTFQHSYLPKSEIRVPLIFGNGRPWYV